MKRILIIEDDRDIVELVRYNLANEGFEVTSVADGSAALASLRKSTPDLVILDLMLPKMPGLEVCKEIRRDAALNRLPILMLTARGIGCASQSPAPARRARRRSRARNRSGPAIDRSLFLSCHASRQTAHAQHPRVSSDLLSRGSPQSGVYTRSVARRGVGHRPLRYPAQRGCLHSAIAGKNRNGSGKSGSFENCAWCRLLV